MIEDLCLEFTFLSTPSTSLFVRGRVYRIYSPSYEEGVRGSDGLCYYFMMSGIFNPSDQKNIRRLLRNRPTHAEKRLWYALKNDQLSIRFRRQYGVGKYIIDFYAPQLRLVIEVDGDSHFQEGAQESDGNRQSYLESIGLVVLRFTDLEVLNDMEMTLDKIKETIIILRRKKIVPPKHSP